MVTQADTALWFLSAVSMNTLVWGHFRSFSAETTHEIRPKPKPKLVAAPPTESEFTASFRGEAETKTEIWSTSVDETRAIENCCK